MASSGVAAESAPRLIIYPAPENSRDPRAAYYVELLATVLDRTTPTHGAYRLQPTAAPMPQGRAIAELAAGREPLDVLWTGTSEERESVLRPIYVPLTKGLLGHRLFLIRRDQADEFAKVTHLEALKAFIACQGRDWPDTLILRAAGLKVTTNIRYRALFRMLAFGRCDYFPRAVHEPFSELDTHRELFPDLVVEQKLLLRYPYPVYFFVARDDEALATRLETGLDAMIQEGGLDQFLRAHPATKVAFERARLAQRRVFDLANPLLSAETPLQDPALWFQIDQSQATPQEE